MTGLPNISLRPIYLIAEEIKKDWKNVYFGAIPYLEALLTLSTINSNYGADSAETIILYFLSNATGYRGEKAKACKKELKAHLKSYVK